MSNILHYKQLTTLKGIKANNEFIVEGPKIICDALKLSVYIKEILINKKNYKRLKELYPELFEFSNIKYLEDISFKKISDTINSQGTIAIADIPKPVEFAKKNIIALNGLQDPGNVGTIIRTAVALGINQFLLDENTPNPYTQKVIRSSVGTILSSNILRCKDFGNKLGELKNNGFKIYSLETNASKNIEDIKKVSPFVLIVGSESKGVDANITTIADEKININIDNNNVESLNAAAAASIAMYLMLSNR